MKKILYDIITEQKESLYFFPLKILLWMLSGLYYLMMTARGFFYQKEIRTQGKLPRPTISIGNITWGGVGKTPLVALIVLYLKEKGLSPAVLMRGYMDKYSNSLPGRSKEGIVSDEGQMLKEKFNGVSVLIGPNRYDNALKHLENNVVDVFVLDDGFQHLSLKRDLDIVALDSTKPFGNGYLLPRGILREPASSLKRADIVVLTKTDLMQADVSALKQQIKSITGNVPIIETVHAPVGLVDVSSNEQKPLSYISLKNICSLCSIGDPLSFERMLDRLEAKRIQSFSFMDHYIYRKPDMINIFRDCRNNGVTTIVTTEKDAVKLRKFTTSSDGVFLNDTDALDNSDLIGTFSDPADLCKIEILALKIEVVIKHGKEQFFQRIDNLLAG